MRLDRRINPEKVLLAIMAIMMEFDCKYSKLKGPVEPTEYLGDLMNLRLKIKAAYRYNTDLVAPLYVKAIEDVNKTLWKFSHEYQTQRELAIQKHKETGNLIPKELE